jgi:hypothetical protein
MWWIFREAYCGGRIVPKHPRKLWELAKLIRSKNAGPFLLTFDIMFGNVDVYHLVKNSGLVTESTIGRLYGLSPADVSVASYDAALSLKVTIPRPTASGSLDDGDVFGGQQYGPLVDLEVMLDDRIYAAAREST